MVSYVVPAFKNIGERSDQRDYRTIGLLHVVSRVSERLINDRLVMHLEKAGVFSDFQYGFRSAGPQQIFLLFWQKGLLCP